MTEHAIFNLTDDDDDETETTGEFPSEQSEPDGEVAPDSSEAGDGDEDESALEDGSRSIRLSVKEILVVPSDNVSRGGHVLPANHPDIQSLAASISSEGLLHHIGVRPLPEPIDGCTHRLVYGFERFIALRDVLGWTTLPCVSKERTDAEAISACMAENAGRRDPTEFDLAAGFALLMSSHHPRLTWEQAAKITGCRPARVRTLVTIMERCPPPLLDAFRVSPTAETRRTLECIAVTVDPDNKEKEETRHRMMVDEWAKQNESAPKANPDIPRRAQRAIDHVKLAHLRDRLAEASEWFDPVNGWQPMTPETRSAVDSVLRHALDPRGHARPIR